MRFRRKKGFIVSGNSGANFVNIGKDIIFNGRNTINFWRNSADNVVKLGNGIYCSSLKIVFKGNNNTLIIGDNVRFTGRILIVGKNRTVTIGDNTTAQGVYILSRDEDVTIGSDCMFSREIEIRATDVHKIYDLDTGERVNYAEPVLIGDKVWIAARAIVSKGATVPDGCVVGAASFVNKKFEQQNAIIAGIPAKLVRENIRWER